MKTVTQIIQETMPLLVAHKATSTLRDVRKAVISALEEAAALQCYGCRRGYGATKTGRKRSPPNYYHFEGAGVCEAPGIRGMILEADSAWGIDCEEKLAQGA